MSSVLSVIGTCVSLVGYIYGAMMALHGQLHVCQVSQATVMPNADAPGAPRLFEISPKGAVPVMKDLENDKWVAGTVSVYGRPGFQ